MGLPTAVYFQEWMTYYIEQILQGNEVMTKVSFYLGGIIKNCFHEQFVNMKKSSKFYMTSYLVYSLADQRQYSGLYVAPDQGQKRGLKPFDKYLQL